VKTAILKAVKEWERGIMELDNVSCEETGELVDRIIKTVEDILREKIDKWFSELEIIKVNGKVMFDSKVNAMDIDELKNELLNSEDKPPCFTEPTLSKGET